MKIIISHSKLHRKGLIATESINKGEFLFNIKGRKIKYLIYDHKSASQAGYNWIGYAKNTWIDPKEYGLYINHSCNPNAAIKGKTRVVAIKNIKNGEEITFDYSFSEADIFWHIKCNCKNTNCRKKIESIQFLSKNIFNKNKEYIPKYFKEVYNKFNISNFKNHQALRKSWVNFITKNFKV